ncbi:MAG: GDSL-type esterase/lipase family protein [Bacteroidota bacterium]
MSLKLPFIVLIFAVSGCTGNLPSEEASVEKSVRDYYDGIRLKDQKIMIEATTADFILYEGGKVWNNDSVFHEMSKYKFSVTYTFSDFAVMIDENRAYASYSAVADFIFDDTVKQTLNFIESAAFEKNDDVWKMSLLQVNEQLSRYDTIHYAPDYLATRVAQFKTEPVEKGTIILVGNSIIEYGNWKRLLGDSSVVNRGVAADNTFGVLTRLDDIISPQPSKVVIEIGINDVSQNIPLNITIDNITVIVTRLRTGLPNTPIYVVSLLPTNEDVKNEYPDAYNKNRMSDVVNEQLKLRSKDSAFVYLDLNSKLKDPEGKLDRKFASNDGLHLNEEGYKVFVGLLRAN